MNTALEKRDFTVTARELSEAHGVTYSGLLSYATNGAFPWMNVGSNPNRKGWVFHKEALTYTMGTIRGNMRVSKYKEPSFVDTLKSSYPKSIGNKNLEEKIDRCLMLIEAILTKLQ